MSIGTQLPAYTLLSHASMTSYCKSLMSYAQACYQQVKEVFLDPNSKDPVGYSSTWWLGILEMSSEKDSPWAPLEWSYQLLLTTDTAVKLEDAGDLQIKLKRKKGKLTLRLTASAQDKGSRLHTSTKYKNPFSFFSFPLPWHWPGKVTLTCLSPRPSLRGTNWNLERLTVPLTFHKWNKTSHWLIPLDLHCWVREDLPGRFDSGLTLLAGPYFLVRDKHRSATYFLKLLQKLFLRH